MTNHDDELEDEHNRYLDRTDADTGIPLWIAEEYAESIKDLEIPDESAIGITTYRRGSQEVICTDRYKEDGVTSVFLKGISDGSMELLATYNTGALGLSQAVEEYPDAIILAETNDPHI
jgi:hypothetical protein